MADPEASTNKELGKDNSVKRMIQNNRANLLGRQSFYGLWFFICLAAIPMSFAVGSAVSYAIGFEIGSDKGWAVGLTVGALIKGALMGWAQWWVLRRKIPGVGRWILASSVGWAIGKAIALVVSNSVFGVVDLALFGSVDLAVVWAVSGVVSGAVGGAIGGTLVGLAQWWVLRRKLYRAEQWILASSVGWAVSSAIVGTVDLATVGMAGLVLTWVMFGAIYGAITGKSWTWLLLRQPALGH
jgi:hypothetical protein